MYTFSIINQLENRKSAVFKLIERFRACPELGARKTPGHRDFIKPGHTPRSTFRFKSPDHATGSKATLHLKTAARGFQMQTQSFQTQTSSQSGGVTIMVTLSLLILLTIAAISMSKNSFKEIQTSGLLRHGALARNVADSGIEWSIYWISLGNFNAAGNEQAGDFIKIKDFLAENNELSGRPKSISNNLPVENVDYSPSSSHRIPVDEKNVAESTFTQSFTIGLTRMGKLPITGMSQGVSGGYTPAAGGISLQAPDLWAIRSDARIRHESSGLVFTHARETWVSTPIK